MGVRRRAVRRVAVFALRLWIGIAGVALAVSCAMPGDAAPVVKIGLIAPFEGVGRPLGYAVLPEVKAAIAEAHASGALGRYRVALVALNDDLDAGTAARQAQALAQDAALLAALGPFDQEAGAAVAQALSAAGVPALIAAPLDVAPPGVTSLCPPTGQIAAALQAGAVALAATASPCATETTCAPEPVVFFPGDAQAAAEELLPRRAAGWRGTLIAGPDALRRWFIQRAGSAAEGTSAVACSLSGAPAVLDSGLPEASLARAATAALMRALAADIRVHGQPSRQGVAEALAQQDMKPLLRWYQVQNGGWQPLDSATLPRESRDAPATAP